jgi:hypothetical protein
MSSVQPIELPPLSSWKVLSLRTTAFYFPSEKVDPAGWWFELMESSPDAELRKPKEGVVRLEDSIENGKRSITTSPGRVDFRLEGEDVGGDPFRRVDAPEEVSPGFMQLSKSLLGLASFPAVKRLAFGSVMDLPVREREDGYRQLSAYLPFEIDASKSRDFLYRINRPRQSRTAEGLIVNRVSVWTVRILRETQLTVSASGQIVSLKDNSAPAYACRVELDINTDAEYTGALGVAILEELVDLAREIYEKGEIP